MKKTLLSIALLGSAFIASSQVLFEDDFNSYPVGALGTNITETAPNQGDWWIYATTATKSEIYNIGTNDNALKLTGSATSGARYVSQYGLKSDWKTRTSGNDVLFVSFIFETPATQNASRNFFRVTIQDSMGTGNAIIGVTFDNLTNKLSGIFHDSLKTSSTATVGTLGNFSQPLLGQTDVVLANAKAYYVEMRYDKTTGDLYWRGLDISGSSAVSVFNIYRTQVRKNSRIGALELYSGSGNTTTNPNSASTTFNIDDILIKARPCYSWDVKANSAFSYTGSRCIGSANLTPVLVSPTSTGIFSIIPSTTTGLNVDATSGIINLGAGTVAGDYSIKFVTVDPYAPASGSTPAVPGACEDSSIVTISILNCAGIEEVSSANFTVYPNPANDVVTVSLADNTQNGSIVLTSADGKVIETRNFTNSSVESFDVKSLTSGVYFFQVGNTTQKVIIK